MTTPRINAVLAIIQSQIDRAPTSGPVTMEHIELIGAWIHSLGAEGKKIEGELADLRSELAAEKKRNEQLQAEMLRRIGGLLSELMKAQQERDAAVLSLKLITANTSASPGGDESARRRTEDGVVGHLINRRKHENQNTPRGMRSVCRGDNPRGQHHNQSRSSR